MKGFETVRVAYTTEAPKTRFSGAFFTSARSRESTEKKWRYRERNQIDIFSRLNC